MLSIHRGFGNLCSIPELSSFRGKVQVFERARCILHPEYDPSSHEALLTFQPPSSMAGGEKISPERISNRIDDSEDLHLLFAELLSSRHIALESNMLPALLS